MRRFIARLINVFRRDRVERELAREVASHLGVREDEYARRGLTPEQARLAARRAMGSVALAQDLHREARTFGWLDDLRQDLRHTRRGLQRTPGFTVVAVLTVALGVGANVAIFGLVSIFSLLALTLAVVGIYGVASYAVGTRTREIGLRVALGAEPRTVIAMVMREALRPVAIGLVVGLVAGQVAAQSIRSVLFGVSTFDPLAVGGMASVLALTAASACYLPARRAASIEPLAALRTES